MFLCRYGVASELGGAITLGEMSTRGGGGGGGGGRGSAVTGQTNAAGTLTVTYRASVLETLLTAQTRLVLLTAIHTEDRRERSTQTDRHENIDASKWRLTDSRGRTVAEG